MSFADKFRLLSPISVDREIHGQKVTFYTCSVRTCAKLSGLLSTLAGHFTTLMGANSERDQGKTEEDYQTEAGEIISKTITQPINPDLATLRANQKERAVSGAISALFAESNRAALGELLMDSMKDEFKRGQNPPTEECLAFVDLLDIPTFIEFLKGLFEANAKVFGDLGKGLGRAVQDKAEELLGSAISVEAKNEEQPTDG